MKLAKYLLLAALGLVQAQAGFLIPKSNGTSVCSSASGVTIKTDGTFINGEYEKYYFKELSKCDKPRQRPFEYEKYFSKEITQANLMEVLKQEIPKMRAEKRLPDEDLVLFYVFTYTQGCYGKLEWQASLKFKDPRCDDIEVELSFTKNIDEENWSAPDGLYEIARYLNRIDYYSSWPSLKTQVNVIEHFNDRKDGTPLPYIKTIMNNNELAEKVYKATFVDRGDVVESMFTAHTLYELVVSPDHFLYKWRVVEDGQNHLLLTEIKPPGPNGTEPIDIISVTIIGASWERGQHL